ncbi:hypothetical protein DB346_16415 [Verrucomicrobia bacterium LW23]|nr:hypothetical protein DB346_16415 [Verrucomicrobia bacterium LW23]
MPHYEATEPPSGDRSRNAPPPPPSRDESYRESIAGGDAYAQSGDGAAPRPQVQNRSAVPPPSLPRGPEFPGRARVGNDDVAVITTPFGDVVIALDPLAAPQTVANFVQLISEGFYNGTTFHRTVPNFVIQGGDPNSKQADRSRHGLGGPGYTVPAEIGLKHVRGAVAMARGRDAVNPTRASNGSQFYICLNNTPELNNKYTVFGRVIKGMDIVDTISNQPRDNRDNPLDNIPMQVVMKKRSEIQGLQ